MIDFMLFMIATDMECGISLGILSYKPAMVFIDAQTPYSQEHERTHRINPVMGQLMN